MEVIQGFREGENVSLGIILKTDEAAKGMYEALAGCCGGSQWGGDEAGGDEAGEGRGSQYDMNLITQESASFQNGISITSIRMSKGLEFDEVLIPQADCSTYASDFDRSLLYIACTRAMHRLTLTYSGKRTEFISPQLLLECKCNIDKHYDLL